mgnify:CR=1 FL=1
MKIMNILVTEKEYEEIANSNGSLLEVYKALKSRFDEADNHKGEWSGNWDYYCSVCHKPFEYRTPHCPHCGAKMKNGSEDLI